MNSGYSLMASSYDLACVTPTSNFIIHDQTIERIPSSPHANQIGAAVNRSSIIVRRKPLSSMISELDIIYDNMADAQCRNTLEVLLQHQAVVAIISSGERSKSVSNSLCVVTIFCPRPPASSGCFTRTRPRGNMRLAAMLASFGLNTVYPGSTTSLTRLVKAKDHPLAEPLRRRQVGA